MAHQLLYSSWLDNGTENTICASSEGLAEKDINYIVDRTKTHISRDFLPDDEDNNDLASTLYLQLPSGFLAIIRIGFYLIPDSNQSHNFIIHAYVTEQGENVSPMLYAINNCFKITLTAEEQQYYLANTVLPQTPFPRPQFKMSQAEIRKFFSQGRLKTLACLLQAIIDSYKNEKIILFNVKYSTLKYWFYAIHCCLPDNILRELTYSTYTFSHLEGCKLICGAPDNKIDSDKEIASGNFVIDILGGATCEDIESAKYAGYIIHRFYEDASAIQVMPEAIERLMSGYHLSLSNAAGVYKLMESDFEWFDSTYDIQYFLGKISLISKIHLDIICTKLWKAFLAPDFKFKLGDTNLPLLAFIFKSTSSNVKREIIEYIDRNHKGFDIYEARSLSGYYSEIMDKLGFIYEYLPSALIENGMFSEFREYHRNNITEMCILLYNIVDRYSFYSAKHGTDAVDTICSQIYSGLLDADEHEPILELCKKAVLLPNDFVKNVLVSGAWHHVQKCVKQGYFIDEDLIFGMMEELISIPVLAAELLKIFAREGKYSEETLEKYIDLCQNYPDETAVIEKVLSLNDAFSSFITDIAIQKFTIVKQTTIEDLTYFFHNLFLNYHDRNEVFDTKLRSFIAGLLPVRQIETADYFLRLIDKHCSDGIRQQFYYLTDYIVSQNAEDIYDFYWNHPDERDDIHLILTRYGKALSPAYTASFVCIALKESYLSKDPDLIAKSLDTIFYASDSCFLPDSNTVGFMDSLYTMLFLSVYQLSAANHTSTSVADQFVRIILRFGKRNDFQNAYSNQLKNFVSTPLSEKTCRTLIAAVLLDIAKDETSVEYEEIISETVSALHKIPLADRQQIYKLILSECPETRNREELKAVLIEVYYSDLTAFQKMKTLPPKKLFGRKN